MLGSLILALLLVTATVLYFYGNRLLHILVVTVIRQITGGMPVHLGSVSWSLWSITLSDLRIDNGPGTWSVPHALHIERLHASVGSFLAVLALHPGCQPNLQRVGPFEFTFGFRVKAIDTLELDGCQLYVEAAEEQDARVLMRGNLRKEPMDGGIGTTRLREFVLEPSQLRWMEPAEASGGSVEQERKTKGSLRLFPSATVESDVDDRGGKLCLSPRRSLSAAGGGLRLAISSGAHRLVVHALSEAERDAWQAALQDAIRQLRQPAKAEAVARSNAPWVEALAAEGEGRKAAWRAATHLRRRNWRRRWEQPAEEGTGPEGAARQSGGDGECDAGGVLAEGSRAGESNGAGEELSVHTQDLEGKAGGEGEGTGEPEGEGEVSSCCDEASVIAEDGAASRDWLQELKESLAAQRWLPVVEWEAMLDRLKVQHQRGQHEVKQLAKSSAMRVEQGEAAAAEARFFDSLEWQVGVLRVRGLELHLNGQQLALGDEGWEMRGFAGAEGELKRRLLVGWTPLGRPPQMGLLAQMLKHSGERAIHATVANTTDRSKELIQTTRKELIQGITAFTGKEQYEFGDLSKAALAKLGTGVAEGFAKLRGGTGNGAGPLEKPLT